MITPADPFPGDIQTAHQLIRELLAKIGLRLHLVAKLRRQFERLLRASHGCVSEKLDQAPLLLFTRNIPAQAQPAPPPTEPPKPAPAPTSDPNVPKTKGHGRKPSPDRALNMIPLDSTP